MPRIVLTGGPGGGKTTAADLFRREIGDHVIVVPEAATLLFTGGFPRTTTPLARRAAQCAIYHVQRNLENVQAAQYPDRILLCDRGTVDGAAYWPDEPFSDDRSLPPVGRAAQSGFYAAVESTEEQEFARYDAVIFFETASIGGLVVEHGNPARIEGHDEAVALDRRLYGIWSKHRRFVVVPHATSFFKKMTIGLAALESIVAQLG